MPVFRFDIALEIVRGTKAFLRMEGGITRNPAPEHQLQETAPKGKKLGAVGRQRAPRTDGKGQRVPPPANNRRAKNALPKRPSGEEAASGDAARRQGGALPDFVIIGAQKSGTSSLFHLLRQHPYVRTSKKKEVHYFDINFDKDTDWYKSHFPSPMWREGRRVLTGESSPYYLYHPHAPQRAVGMIPGARLLVLLRNPVDRAYSHYQASVRYDRDSLSFEEALEMEEQRLQERLERILKDESYVSSEHQFYSYLTRGIYVDQISRWLEFFPQDQMLVMKSEDFFERPWETLGETLDFLGLPNWESETWQVRNKGDYEQQMDPATRQRLENYFAPHNRRLYDLLGRDFGW